jgi:hypothetical protein
LRKVVVVIIELIQVVIGSGDLSSHMQLFLMSLIVAPVVEWHVESFSAHVARCPGSRDRAIVAVPGPEMRAMCFS